MKPANPSKLDVIGTSSRDLLGFCHMNDIRERRVSGSERTAQHVRSSEEHKSADNDPSKRPPNVSPNDNDHGHHTTTTNNGFDLASSKTVWVKRKHHPRNSTTAKRKDLQKCDNSEKMADSQRSSPRRTAAPRGAYWKRHLIEVFPGTVVPLCGSEETLHSFLCEKVAECHCSACDTFLYCVQDAGLVLCPTCHSISPRDGDPNLLGLGLSLEEVARLTS